MAKRSELEEVVQEFLSLPEETRLAIARDIVRKLVEGKRSQRTMYGPAGNRKRPCY